MSGFSHEWLTLREGADFAARNRPLTEVLVQRLLAGGDGPCILDLGAGTGANLRYLAPRLGAAQHWWLVDHDVKLLTRLPTELYEWARIRDYRVTDDAVGLYIEGQGFTATVRWCCLDLAKGLSDLPLRDVDVVTASALLDLVSGEWIDSLARTCDENGCIALFTLNYDGCIQWQPALAADTAVRALLNRHQRRDKGFGLALGPDAAYYAAARFKMLDFELHEGRSAWRLDATQIRLQQTLATDWAQAALQIDPLAHSWIEAWLGARNRLAQRADSRLIVGHIDVLALNPRKRLQDT